MWYFHHLKELDAKMDLDHFTTQQSDSILVTENGFPLTNITKNGVLFNDSANNTHQSQPDDWNYNYWPLIISIMPLITVGGNLLVIVSISLFLSL